MYLVFLIVGAGFIVLSVIFGAVSDLEGVGFAFLRPTVIALTLTVMGGIGLILAPRIGSYAAFPISAAGGLFAGFLLHRFVIIPLHRLQHTSAHYKQSLIGTTAKVVLAIPQGGYGKIKYNVSGSVVTSPAKTEDGSEIKKDTDVVIQYIKNNAYFVRERGSTDVDLIATKEEAPNTN